MVKSKLLFMLALSLVLNLSNEKNSFENSDTQESNTEESIFQTKRKEYMVNKHFLENIILTDTERGIYTEDNYVFNVMLSDFKREISFLSLEEKERLEHLNVRKFASQFLLSPLLDEKKNHHQNTSLYNQETDDLDWELLFCLLKENGKKEIERKKERWANYKEYYEYYSGF